MNKGQRLCKRDGMPFLLMVELGKRHQLGARNLAACTCVCEVCGGNHGTWNCCDDCNYDDHRCHFCGDDLNHDGTLLDGTVNTCYLDCLRCGGSGKIGGNTCDTCNGCGAQG